MTEWWDSGIFERLYNCIWFLQPLLGAYWRNIFRLLQPYWEPLHETSLKNENSSTVVCNNQFRVPAVKWRKLSVWPWCNGGIGGDFDGFRILFDSCEHLWDSFGNHSFDYCSRSIVIIIKEHKKIIFCCKIQIVEWFFGKSGIFNSSFWTQNWILRRSRLVL